MTLPVIIKRAAHPALRVHGDLAHASPSLQDGAFLQRLRPIGDVGRPLRADWAAEQALAVQLTTGPSVITARDGGIVRYPPVPAQLVKPATPRLTQNA